jgi:hypothetical protein
LIRFDFERVRVKQERLSLKMQAAQVNPMGSLTWPDWQAPWWQPWRELGRQVAAQIQGGAAVHEALNRLALGEVRFVPQSALPPGVAYEAFIFQTKTVPTRDNTHDFFNGLAWLTFPRIKARLNALQSAQIAQKGIHARRGALRDALTVFDENAAFLCSKLHAPVIAALRGHDWERAFHTHRGLLGAHPPVLFGHALLEKLVSPYKSVVAHVFPVQAAVYSEAFSALWDAPERLDAAVAAQLGDTALQPKPFVPLPVLGVPAWWAPNERADFYADRTVFRPPKA